ncbi:MAG: Ldh family oxidoreductase [Caldilineaceae bacterium]|nr:Ldh family oxidoreductase [Caldilineaceae bacterium]
MALKYLNIPEQDAIRVDMDAIQRQVVAILQAVNVPERHAQITAEILTAASLRGVDTHGVGNVTGYVQAIEEGRYTIPQSVDVVAESATTALLDCGNGLGFVAAHRAMELAIAKAKQQGVGMATVRNGHHIGMVGYYPLMAVAQDMIGMAVTNASRSMRPLHGAHPRLGTNPIAFGAPAGKERPFLLDMATTTVASGKLGLARRLGVSIPEGWAVDSEGIPLTEPPAQRSEAWAQTPLGNTLEQGGHKGYGLAVMVDILAGVLSGGGFSAQLAGGENMTWTMAIDIAAFRPVAEFKAMMDEMIQALHATPPEPGAERVLVAGDPEFDTEAERRERGIPLHATQYDAIIATARRVGAPVMI